MDYDVINAGLQGGDPICQIKFFKEILLPNYQPDVVFFALNNSDITEIIIRGDSTRFKMEGTVKFKNPPWLEPFYGLSHTVRGILLDSVATTGTLLIRRA